MTLYNATKNDINTIKTLPAGDWWKYVDNWSKNHPDAKAAGDRLTSANHQIPSFTNSYTPQYREGDLAGSYKKPVQPVIYQPTHPYTKSIADNTAIPQVNNMFGAPQGINVGGPQGPSNYAFQYRDDNGQQQVIYFPNASKMAGFVQDQPWTSKSATANSWQISAPYLKKQYGGKAQTGGLFQTNKIGYVDSVLNANKNLEWVQRLYQKNPQRIQIPGQPYPSTHFMQSADGRVYPTVVNIGGQLQYKGNRAYDYADSTHTYIQFPNDAQAQWFGENYKMGTGVLKNFQKGGMAMTPQQQHMGLNDPRYHSMMFPMQGMNMFRGLDNGQPVLIQDQMGQKKILKGKYDTANFYGNVHETRL